MRGSDSVVVFTGLADLPETLGVARHTLKQRTKLGVAAAGARNAAEFVCIADLEIAAGAGGERAGVGERDFQDTPGAAVLCHRGELVAGVVEARGAAERGVEERRGFVFEAAETGETQPTAFVVGRAGGQGGRDGEHDGGEPAGGDTHGAMGELAEGPEAESTPGRGATHVYAGVGAAVGPRSGAAAPATARKAARAGSGVTDWRQPRTRRLSGAGPVSGRKVTSDGRCCASDGVINVAPRPARTRPMPLARGQTSSAMRGAMPALEKAARMRS